VAEFRFTYDDSLSEWLGQYARRQGCTPAEVLRRELIWLRRWDRLMGWTDEEKRKSDYDFLIEASTTVNLPPFGD
jgi:hypothetical protein